MITNEVLNNLFIGYSLATNIYKLWGRSGFVGCTKECGSVNWDFDRHIAVVQNEP